jgi:hypothetical protein
MCLTIQVHENGKVIYGSNYGICGRHTLLTLTLRKQDHGIGFVNIWIWWCICLHYFLYDDAIIT